MDAATLGAALGAVDRARQWQQAGDLLQEALRRRWHVDAVSYGVVASALERSSQWRASSCLLASLPREQRLVACNAAMRGASLKRGREIFKLLQGAEEGPCGLAHVTHLVCEDLKA